jgi:hypothetical protein
VREILKETLDGKTGFRLTFLRESFFQLIAEKATANFEVTNRVANRRACRWATPETDVSLEATEGDPESS